MQPEDDLIEQLRRWGNVTASRYAANEDGPSAGDNVLSRRRDMALAHKRKQEDEHELVGRSGEERRRFMAARSGVKSMHILPMWAVDPVRASNDADAPRDRAPLAFVDAMPDELLWVDRALCRLEREKPLWAQILRAQFLEPGLHERKAQVVEKKYGGRLTVRQYRKELQRALDWMRGRMAA